ncbi:MAG: hypothetical protein BJ554DRAFT_4278, partial [Olpidium bornovanus]
RRFPAASNEEAGRYLETFKSFEHKPPDLIRERVDEKEGYLGRLAAVLTSVKSVNKTDVVTLASHFGVSSHVTGDERFGGAWGCAASPLPQPRFHRPEEPGVDPVSGFRRSAVPAPHCKRPPGRAGFLPGFRRAEGSPAAGGVRGTLRDVEKAEKGAGAVAA